MSAKCPNNIAVIGGGRWAREVVKTLLLFVPETVTLSMHSKGNASSLVSWVAGLKPFRQVAVYSEYPTFEAVGSHALLVVNATRDHDDAVAWGLYNGIPTLVEKPVSLHGVGARRIREQSVLNKVSVCAAHVFLFSNIVQEFCKLVIANGSVSQISVTWIDPEAEKRHGEAKRFDSSVPVYADVLPHILSVISTIVPLGHPQVESVRVARGGALVHLTFRFGNTLCYIMLERNGKLRKRMFEVQTSNNVFALDLTEEPGSIQRGITGVDSVVSFLQTQRPLEAMLATFLGDAEGGGRDSRFDLNLAVTSAELSDTIYPIYCKELLLWLKSAMLRHYDARDSDIKYALAEIERAHSGTTSESAKQILGNMY